MIKRLAALLFVATLAACGDGEPEDNSPDQTIQPVACEVIKACVR